MTFVVHPAASKFVTVIPAPKIIKLGSETALEARCVPFSDDFVGENGVTT
jgi:hypothetical protein